MFSCACFFRFLARSTFSPYLANFASYGKCFISYTILCNCALNCNALKCNALQMIRKKSMFFKPNFLGRNFLFSLGGKFQKKFFFIFLKSICDSLMINVNTFFPHDKRLLCNNNIFFQPKRTVYC